MLHFTIKIKVRMKEIIKIRAQVNEKKKKRIIMVNENKNFSRR